MIKDGSEIALSTPLNKIDAALELYGQSILDILEEPEHQWFSDTLYQARHRDFSDWEASDWLTDSEAAGPWGATRNEPYYGRLTVNYTPSKKSDGSGRLTIVYREV